MPAGYKTILTCVAVGLAFASVSISVDTDVESEAPVPMTGDDGATYSVAPRETLGAAMVRAAIQEKEEGHCVPEPMEKKPAGSVACRCYEVTQCEGNESHQCKRHCRKDLCECCSI